MCESCGCGEVGRFGVQPMQPGPDRLAHLLRPEDHPVPVDGGHWHVREDGSRYWHSHEDGKGHGHSHGAEPSDAVAAGSGEGVGEGRKTLEIHEAILGRNARLAERNRGFLRALRVRAVNVMSSPGAGKTTLLEQSIRALRREGPVAVVVGDLATANDARRLADAGGRVVQITTGSVCHLDAEMVARGIESLDLSECRLLFLENVGNLVCPADFDLGEDRRVVLLSVTEGEDKPLKYPPMFRAADAVVLTKLDLAEVCGVDLELLRRQVRSVVGPTVPIFELSARTGRGMEGWLPWLRS